LGVLTQLVRAHDKHNERYASSRKLFDRLTSAGGVIVVVVLLVAAGLLIWGRNFVNSNVHNQLARREIVFPPKAAFAYAKAGTEIAPAMIPSVSRYAGQQLLTGPQAQAYADHFIAIHLSELPYGGAYSKISAAAIASFAGAATMLVLVGFGFQHARRTAPEKVMLAPKAKAIPAS
jgi:hypothetical protein